MPEPPDLVQVIKQESVAGGGAASDEFDVYLDAPIEPQEDALEAAGYYLNDATTRDRNVGTYRESGNMMFKDQNANSGAAVTLTQLLATGGSGLPAATAVGQVLFSVDALTFSVRTPVTSSGGWLVNDDGTLLVGC